jgi:hypothetical protein
VTCRHCGQALFTDEALRLTCGGCFRTAALRLDYLLALAALGQRRADTTLRVRMPA